MFLLFAGRTDGNDGEIKPSRAETASREASENLLDRWRFSRDFDRASAIRGTINCHFAKA